MWLEYPAVALSIIGTLMVARKMRNGFLVWIFANFMWIIVGYLSRMWGVFILFSAYLVISAYGYWNWKR